MPESTQYVLPPRLQLYSTPSLPRLQPLHQVLRELKMERRPKILGPFGILKRARTDGNITFSSQLGLETPRYRSEPSHKKARLMDEEDVYLASRKPKTKGSWTKAEDKHLLKLTKVHGPKGWAGIAAEIGTKSAKQCRDRWHNQLNPAIVTTPWTAEEDELLLKGNKDLGNRWAVLAKIFPGRTPNAIKNRYHCMIKRTSR